MENVFIIAYFLKIFKKNTSDDSTECINTIYLIKILILEFFWMQNS